MLLYLWLLYVVFLSVALFRNGFRNIPSKRPLSSAPKRPKRILVVGATGKTGREVVVQGLRRGYEVTAFVRDPSGLGIDNSRLKIVKGDVLDFASVEAAAKNQDAVLSALGHRRFFYPTRILSQGTENLLRAMKSENVRRLICVTSLGIGGSVGRLGLYYTLIVVPFIVPFYFWDKTRQERLISGSDREWVIVRPGMLKGGRKTGSYRHGLKIGSYLWTVGISRADVADFMLSQLETDEYLGTAVGVAR